MSPRDWREVQLVHQPVGGSVPVVHQAVVDGSL
jgi:hypothetical protein